MNIPLDALASPWASIISLGLFFGIIGIMCGVEMLVAKWRKSRSQ